MLETNTGNRALCAWTDCSGIFELAEAGKAALPDHGLAPDAGSRSAGVRTDGSFVQVFPLGYPPEMNVRLKRAVIRRNADDFSACMTELITACQKEHHDPKEIKEMCLFSFGPS